MYNNISGLKKQMIFFFPFMFCLLLLFSACNKSVKRDQSKLPNLIQSVSVDNGHFLSISDIQFNPFFDPDLVNDLVTSDIDNWDSIFRSTKVSGFGKFGEDTNYSLLMSSLEQMNSVTPNPDYIIISGSIIANKFGINFQKYTKSDKKIELDEFIKKTLKFVFAKFQNKFPDIMILPVVGNNDSCCGEYKLKPNSSYLRILNNLWLPIVNKSTDPSMFNVNVKRGGFYSVYSPVNNKHKLIVLNSTFLSTSYHMDKHQDLFGQRLSHNTLQGVLNKQFSWLKKELSSSKEAGEKVWLIYHTPPGINVFRTLKGENDCNENVKTLWKNSLTNMFLNTVKEYSSIITANIAGHSHFSDFSLILDNKKPASFIHTTNSLSPISGNNPGFQVVQYNKKLNEITDFKICFLKSSSTLDNANWSIGSNFSKVFGIKAFNQASLDSSYMQLESNSNLKSKHIDFYNESKTAKHSLNNENWEAYWCAAGNVTRPEFIDCYCKE